MMLSHATGCLLKVVLNEELYPKKHRSFKKSYSIVLLQLKELVQFEIT